MFGMNETQLQTFVEKFLATAVANQAMLKCKQRRLPLTEENVIFFVGDFFDTTNPEFEGVIDKINDAIAYVIECPDVARNCGESRGSNVIQFPGRIVSLLS